MGHANLWVEAMGHANLWVGAMGHANLWVGAPHGMSPALVSFVNIVIVIVEMLLICHVTQRKHVNLWVEVSHDKSPPCHD